MEECPEETYFGFTDFDDPKNIILVNTYQEGFEKLVEKFGVKPTVARNGAILGVTFREEPTPEQKEEIGTTQIPFAASK